MGLNDFREEAAAFLQRVSGKPDSSAKLLGMLEEEIATLKQSVDGGRQLSHHLYDVLPLLFEMAALHGADLDSEWVRGREKKRVKY